MGYSPKTSKYQTLFVLNEKANDVVKKGKVFQSQFFSSLFINIDGEHKKIFKETLELMEKNLEDLMEEK